MPKTKVLINPFTGQFDLIRAQEPAAGTEQVCTVFTVGEDVIFTVGAETFNVGHEVGSSGTFTTSTGDVYEWTLTVGQTCATKQVKADYVENVILTNLECNASAAVHDPCHETATENVVQTETDNDPANWESGVFGIIIEKIDATHCNVMLFGTLTGLAGFTVGKVLFLGTDGKLTQSPPASGVLQKVGRYLPASKAFVQMGEKYIRV